MTARDAVLGELGARILGLRLPHPTRVAIDGPDAAGKTTLADELAVACGATGRAVIRASIDGFHRPRADRYRRFGDSADAFYRDSFDYDQLRGAVLLSLGPGGDRRYRTAAFDFRSDAAVAAQDRLAGSDDILLFDGVFLLRPELADCWDYRIFVHADFGETIRRAMMRDQSLFGSAEQVRERYERKYVPGQELYFAESRPREHADVIVDNNTPTAPVLIARHQRR